MVIIDITYLYNVLSGDSSKTMLVAIEEPLFRTFHVYNFLKHILPERERERKRER